MEARVPVSMEASLVRETEAFFPQEVNTEINSGEYISIVHMKMSQT